MIAELMLFLIALLRTYRTYKQFNFQQSAKVKTYCCSVLELLSCPLKTDPFLPLQLHNKLTMAQKLSVLLPLFGRKKAHRLARPNLSFFVFQV